MVYKITLPKTVDDYISDYERCKKAVENVYKTSEIVQKLSDETGLRFGGYHVDGYLSRCNQNLLESAWKRIIDAAGISRYMDAQAVEEFERSLKSNPPAFTKDTIRATLVQCQSDAEMMFNRGVYNLFSRLSDSYKSNTREAFCLSNRVVIRGVSTPSWGRSGGFVVNHYYSDTLNDLHRCLCVLLEQPYSPRGLEVQVNDAWKNGEPFENDYLQLKGYKNGNAHLHIKSPILLERINSCIANHCGDQIARAA